MSETDVSTATSFDPESFDDPVSTAHSFHFSDPDLLEFVKMGKRAAKARRRAARLAAETNTVEQVQKKVEGMEENESELTASSPLNSSSNESYDEGSRVSMRSKIPVAQKGYLFDNNNNKVTAISDHADGNLSKIPRLVDKLVYLYRKSESSVSDTGSDPTSYNTADMISGKENGKTCRDWVTPIPHCDHSTEDGSISTGSCTDENEEFKIIAEANGVQVELDMTAFLGGINLEVAGLKIV